MTARCEVSYAHGESPVTGSSFGRELVYAIAHAIHHYALISIMARLMDAKLPEHFGFRLIAVFLASQAVVEWRWNLDRLEPLGHEWKANTWISSGFDEPGAQQTRGKTFGEALRQNSVGSLEWLRWLHRSHSPERGAYSTCMHRDDAATVSYTEVMVSRRAATVRHAPGAPCCTPLLSAFRLQLHR